MLTNLLKLSNNIQLPDDFLSLYTKRSSNVDITSSKPNLESTNYLQQENFNNLMTLVVTEMGKCPVDTITLKLIESFTLSDNIRKLTLTGIVNNNKRKLVEKFKKEFLTNISQTIAFFNFDEDSTYQVEYGQLKGDKFISQNEYIYDINGNNCDIDIKDNGILFVYNDEADFDLFNSKIDNINNLQIPIYYLCLTDNFLQRKHNLFKSKQLMKSNDIHYFTNNKSYTDEYFGKKLPQIILVNSNKEILENTTIDNLENLDINKIIDNKNDSTFNDAPNTHNINFWWSQVENVNKRKYLFEINSNLFNNGLKRVTFGTLSEFICNKHGMLSFRTLPVFSGEAETSQKNVLDSFIEGIVQEGKLDNISNIVQFIN